MTRPWKVSYYAKDIRVRVRSFSTKKQAESFMLGLPSMYTAFLRYQLKSKVADSC